MKKIAEASDEAVKEASSEIARNLEELSDLSSQILEAREEKEVTASREMLRGTGSRPDVFLLTKYLGQTTFKTTRELRMLNTPRTFQMELPDGSTEEITLKELNKRYNQMLEKRKGKDVTDLDGRQVKATEVLDEWIEDNELLETLSTNDEGRLLHQPSRGWLASVTTKEGSKIKMTYHQVEKLNRFAEFVSDGIIVTDDRGTRSMTLDELRDEMDGGGLRVLNPMTEEFVPVTEDRIQIYNSTYPVVKIGSTWDVATDSLLDEYEEEAARAYRDENLSMASPRAREPEKKKDEPQDASPFATKAKMADVAEGEDMGDVAPAAKEKAVPGSDAPPPTTEPPASNRRKSMDYMEWVVADKHAELNLMDEETEAEEKRGVDAADVPGAKAGSAPERPGADATDQAPKPGETTRRASEDYIKHLVATEYVELDDLNEETEADERAQGGADAADVPGGKGAEGTKAIGALQGGLVSVTKKDGSKIEMTHRQVEKLNRIIVTDDRGTRSMTLDELLDEINGGGLRRLNPMTEEFVIQIYSSTYSAVDTGSTWDVATDSLLDKCEKEAVRAYQDGNLFMALPRAREPEKPTALEEISERKSHAADQATKPEEMENVVEPSNEAFKNSSEEFAENLSAEAETTAPVSKALQSDRGKMRNLLAEQLECLLDRIEKMVLGREGEKFRYSKEDADAIDRDYQTFVNKWQDRGFDPEKNKDEPWAQAMNRMKKLVDKLRPPTA